MLLHGISYPITGQGDIHIPFVAYGMPQTRLIKIIIEIYKINLDIDPNS